MGSELCLVSAGLPPIHYDYRSNVSYLSDLRVYSNRILVGIVLLLRVIGLLLRFLFPWRDPYTIITKPLDA